MAINWINRIREARQERREEEKRLKEERKQETDRLTDDLKKEKRELENAKAQIRVGKLQSQLNSHKYGNDPLSLEQKLSLVQNAQKFSGERFLKDNERIWTVTTIFLPLSLAGLSQLKDKAFTTVMLLGLGSIFLITFWYIATEKLRKFQDDNMRAFTLFDLYLGMDTNFLFYEEETTQTNLKEVEKQIKKLQKATWYEKFTEWLGSNGWVKILRKIPIQRARLYMYYLVTLVWLIAMAHAVYREIHPKSSEPYKVQIVKS